MFPISGSFVLLPALFCCQIQLSEEAANIIFVLIFIMLLSLCKGLIQSEICWRLGLNWFAGSCGVHPWIGFSDNCLSNSFHMVLYVLCDLLELPTMSTLESLFKPHFCHAICSEYCSGLPYIRVVLDIASFFWASILYPGGILKSQEMSRDLQSRLIGAQKELQLVSFQIGPSPTSAADRSIPLQAPAPTPGEGLL